MSGGSIPLTGADVAQQQCRANTANRLLLVPIASAGSQEGRI